MNGTYEAETDKRIDRLMGRMDLRDKVGQCLTLNFTGCEITAYERRFVNEFRCGGLRVTPHITGVNDEYTLRKLAPYLTPGQYAERIRRLQEMALDRNGIPLHIVTDQEGDLSVDILRGGVNLFPSNMGLAATNDVGLVEKAFRVVARQLRAHGIGMIHSPELDVNINPLNPEIGMRAFSDDPELCARFGIAALKGLRAGGIIAAAKHFPGRGDSEIDAHDDLDILRMKAEAGLLAEPLADPARTESAIRDPENAAICREVFERCAIVVRDRRKSLPLDAATPVLVVESHVPLYHEKCNDLHYHPGMFMEWMARYTDRLVRLETASPATERDVARFRERVAAVEVVAFFNTYWRGSASNRALIREAIALGKKVIVATNDLYDAYFLPTADTIVCTFGAVPEGTRIAADVIFGRAEAKGQWPLRLIKKTDTVTADRQIDHKVAGHFAKSVGKGG